MLISSIRCTSGFCYEDSGWLTLDAKWLVLGTSVGNQGCTLSQYVHNVDNKPGLITKVLSYYRSCSISGSCILGCSTCLLSCHLPICIHGNSCLWGQLPAIEQCLNRLVSILSISLWDTCINLCLVYTNETQEFNLDCIHYISRVNVLVGSSTHVDSLMAFKGQL